jgi:chromosome segregation ATPase
MSSNTFLRAAALLTLLGLSAIAVPAQQQDPSQQPSSDPVADAARKAREQQKTAPKPKRVITNDDMPSAPADTSSASKSEGAASSSSADQGGADKDKDSANDSKGEAYWRKRFKDAHDKLAQAEKELDILQRELNKNAVQYYPDPQKALDQQYNRSDINNKTAKIDAKKKEIEDLHKHISDMEDELRSAGGDPGWAR